MNICPSKTSPKTKGINFTAIITVASDTFMPSQLLSFSLQQPEVSMNKQINSRMLLTLGFSPPHPNTVIVILSCIKTSETHPGSVVQLVGHSPVHKRLPVIFQVRVHAQVAGSNPIGSM